MPELLGPGLVKSLSCHKHDHSWKLSQKSAIMGSRSSDYLTTLLPSGTILPSQSHYVHESITLMHERRMEAWRIWNGGVQTVLSSPVPFL